MRLRTGIAKAKRAERTDGTLFIWRTSSQATPDETHRPAPALRLLRLRCPAARAGMITTEDSSPGALPSGTHRRMTNVQLV